MICALYAGYAMGQSRCYLKTNLLLLVIEVTDKCLEYSMVRDFQLKVETAF